MRKGTGLNDDVMFSTLPALYVCVCVSVRVGVLLRPLRILKGP